MIYLDNAATTRPDAAAFARAAAFAQEQYFNPSARYGGGLCVREELSRARATLLQTIADERFELIFTSGGTEADNQAILGCARRGNVVVTAGEHAAVHAACTELKNRGVEVRFASIRADGGVEESALLSLVDEKTCLVSVIHVGNETGVVNEIAALARAIKEKNPRCLFHSDGVQAFGKLSFRLPKEVDLYSVSAHKIGGLKGTGALFKRKTLNLPPLIYGGGQEGTLRSGTENVLGILSFAYAAEGQFAGLVRDEIRLAELRELLWSLLDREIFVRLTPMEHASPYLLSVAARGLRGEILQRMLEGAGVIVGTGSACSSKKPYSRVIEACGVDRSLLGGVLRLSFCKDTSKEEIVACANAVNEQAHALKERL